MDNWDTILGIISDYLILLLLLIIAVLIWTFPDQIKEITDKAISIFNSNI